MIDDNEVRARLAALPSPPIPQDVYLAIEQRLAEERKVVVLTTGHKRRLNWLVAAAAVLGLLALVGVSERNTPTPVAAGTPVVRAGAAFTAPVLLTQIQDRMVLEGESVKTESFADSPSAITACARAIEAYGRIMFLDVGTYDQNSAVVIVTTYPANTDYEEVWVVSPDCGESDAMVYRHMIADVDRSTITSV